MWSLVMLQVGAAAVAILYARHSIRRKNRRAACGAGLLGACCMGMAGLLLWG